MSVSTRPFVEIFVKSSSFNRDQIAPSLVCQQWVMALRILQQNGCINLVVTPINPERPAKAYKDLFAGRLLPVAWVMSGSVNGKDLTNLAIDSPDSLDSFMSMVGYPNLNPQLKVDELRKAQRICEDLYKNFKLHLESNPNGRLLNDLQNINSFLGSSNGPFLFGGAVSYVDCQLMPRLHHIRVAGKVYKNFSIPHELRHLRNYVRQMYNLDAFTFSCISYRDLLNHYSEKYGLPHGVRVSLLGSDILSTMSDDEADGVVEENGGIHPPVQIVYDITNES